MQLDTICNLYIFIKHITLAKGCDLCLDHCQSCSDRNFYLAKAKNLAKAFWYCQINDIRKCSEFPEVDESVRSDMRVSEDSTSDECDGVEHVVHVTVHGLAGFVPCERQVAVILVSL